MNAIMGGEGKSAREAGSGTPEDNPFLEFYKGVFRRKKTKGGKAPFAGTERQTNPT